MAFDFMSFIEELTAIPTVKAGIDYLVRHLTGDDNMAAATEIVAGGEQVATALVSNTGAAALVDAGVAAMSTAMEVTGQVSADKADGAANNEAPPAGDEMSTAKVATNPAGAAAESDTGTI